MDIVFQKQASAVHVLYGETMGTRWRVNAVAPARVDLHDLHRVIQAPLDRVVAQMSTWEADSDLCRYNRAAADSWQRLPLPFFEVLQCALGIAQASGGAYDPTVGPLVGLWGFGADAQDRRVPDAHQIAEARACVGWQRIALRTDSQDALQPGGVSLDLSAIAKGYGVDAVVAALRAHGIGAALIEVGGELRGYGRKPDGGAWRVMVEAAPEQDDEIPCVLALDDTAVATSGTCWHRFKQDGHEYAHTLDPRAGTPTERTPSSVTVVADDAMHADAWATALTVMGMDAGYGFAEAQGFAARFVGTGSDGFVVRDTPAFERYRAT